MRLAIPIALLFAAAACKQTQRSGDTSGWHLTPDHGAYEGNLAYNFGDADKTVFVAKCNGSPWFMVLGGVYPDDANSFTLTADDHSWTLPISKGEHGGGLFVEQAAPGTAIATAKDRIGFKVGNWTREIRPGPELAKFVASCVAS